MTLRELRKPRGASGTQVGPLTRTLCSASEPLLQASSALCNTLQIHLMTDAHLGPVAFASLGLHPKVMDGIRQAGFTQCTPIQAQTLPIALAGRDVAGQAQTGTGKTAAFLVALYQALLTRAPAASRSPTSIPALI